MTTCICAFTAAPGVEPWTATWHIAHKAHHLATFPTTSITTLANLDLLIKLAANDRIRPPRIRGERGCL